MSEPAKSTVTLADFPGLIDNVDQRDLPPGGAEVQVNATCIRLGELQIRRGLREVTFEADL
jgi:hypothetical protein